MIGDQSVVLTLVFSPRHWLVFLNFGSFLGLMTT